MKLYCIGSLDDIDHSSPHTISWSSQNSVRIKSQVAFGWDDGEGEMDTNGFYSRTSE